MSEEQDLREKLVMCMKTLHGRGLITGIGGNASVRLGGTQEVLITPDALYKGDLKPTDVVKIDFYGNILEGVFKPSIEWHFHSAIYSKRSDVNAVIHAHSPMTTGLAIAGKKIEPVTPESAVMLGDVPILEFKCPGTAELGELVGNNILGHRALILQNHGVIAVGSSIVDALTTVEILEETSTMMFVASHFGGAKPIRPDQIELIKKSCKT